MKNIYILIVSSILMMSSCSDFLDSNSSSALDKGTAITTLDELVLGVDGVYSIQGGQQAGGLGYYGTYSSEFTLYADMLGADFEPKSNTNQLAPIGQYQVDTYHTLSEAFYYKFYAGLARANDVLDQYDNVNFIASNPKEVAQMEDLKGQLYALRALYHFDLARLFSKLPTTVADMNAENSGIVLSDRVFEPTYIGKRATLKETYDLILADLNTALPLLSKDKKLGHINYWTAKGLQARLYLYLNKNTEALATAKEIIDTNKYPLYTIDKYKEVWLEEGSSESLFEILITSAHSAQRNSIGYYTHNDNGYAECGLTKTFKAYLDTKTTDIRATLIEKESDNNYYPQKYNGRGGDRYVNNAKVMRISEIYLIAAEAALKSGNMADAVKYINTLRKNRITGYVDVASINLNDILEERRLELYCEGHNAWDYWRNKLSVSNPFVGVVNYDDVRTILPLPNREITLGKGILVQNPTKR